MYEMFSPTEKTVIDIIGRRKITLAELTEELARVSQHESFDLNNYVAGVVRRIVKKCDHYKLNWTIEGQGSGRGGRTVWKEKRI